MNLYYLLIYCYLHMYALLLYLFQLTHAYMSEFEIKRIDLR